MAEGNGVQGFSGPGKGVNQGQQKEAKYMQNLGETAIRRRARDVPYIQPEDQPISGYNTLGRDRDDLRGLADPARTERFIQAETNRLGALQGLQNIADFTTMLPEDFQMFLQSQMVDPNGIVPGVGKVLVGSDHPFWDWAAKKEALRMQEEYEAFKYSQIDLSTPESRQFWESRHPELVRKLREGQRKDRIAKATLEDIGLFGVQDEKDLWVLFEKEKGFSRNPLGTSFVQVDGRPLMAQRPLGATYNAVRDGPFGLPAGIQNTVLPGSGASSYLTMVVDWLKGSPRPQTGAFPLSNIG